jgi:signal transduction histidine kinase
MQPYDVNLIVLDCLRSTEVPTNISIFQNLADGLPRLPLDKDKIRQVLLNLIQNAVQAMTQGGELWLTSKFETGTGATGGRVSIAIRDTGEGISSEDLTKIFEPLFSTKAKGTGLGLPISKGLVERHGGTIEVDSIRGKGSTFTVKLPLREVAQNV